MLSTRYYRTIRVAGLLIVPAVLALGVGGCGSKEQPGDKKEDWAKSTPPPQYHGPGQPGGPPAGAASGPASTPPASATGGTQ